MKIIFTLFLMINICVLSYGQSNIFQETDSIRLSIKLDKENKSCFFKIVNNSQRSIQTSSIAETYSRIVFIDEKGRLLYNFYNSTFVSIIITPGETRTWEHNYVWTIIERIEESNIKNPSFYWSLFDKSEILPPPHLKFEDMYKNYRSNLIKIEF